MKILCKEKCYGILPFQILFVNLHSLITNSTFANDYANHIRRILSDITKHKDKKTRRATPRNWRHKAFRQDLCVFFGRGITLWLWVFVFDYHMADGMPAYMLKLNYRTFSSGITSLCLQRYEDFMMFASFPQRNIENTIHYYILHIQSGISGSYGMYRCKELLYVYTLFL